MNISEHYAVALPGRTAEIRELGVWLSILSKSSDLKDVEVVETYF